MTPRELVDRWRDRARELEPYSSAAARAFETAASELANAISAAEAELLTLAEASRESSYSPETLRHLIADGRIPNAGKKGAPRIRRADLPRRPAARGVYDVDADARSLVRRHA